MVERKKGREKDIKYNLGGSGSGSRGGGGGKGGKQVTEIKKIIK